MIYFPFFLRLSRHWITYPDGSTDQNVYTHLDLTKHKDRLNRWTRYVYNLDEQLTSVTDAAGRVTGYDRCICGQLKGITDPLQRRTTWSQDIEGRTLTKTYPDATTVNYAYWPNTGNLKTVTDAKGQVATYTYGTDDAVSDISYTASIATHAVDFTYDPVYPRLATMADGTGTTSYGYDPVTNSSSPGAGRLQTVTGPLATINYVYDPLGRVTSTAIGSASSGVTYDSLGRVTNATNALGSFNYGYYDVTPRLQSVSYPNGQSTTYNYLDAAHDFRLSEIKNLTAGSTVLSQNDYTYNPVGTIATWQQQTDANAPTIWNYQYDGADQLLSAVKSSTDATPSVLSQFSYGYDLAGNRIRNQAGLRVTNTTFSNLNQPNGGTAGGPMQFAGHLDQPGTVKVADQTATVDANNNFSVNLNVTPGTTNVAVVAANLNGMASTNNYQVVVPSGTVAVPAYDLNGNMTDNGQGQTYAWDAKDQLVGIFYSTGANAGNHTEFTYDGLNRRVAIKEMTGTTLGSGTVTSTKQFVWLGTTMAEERDASNAVTKRFYPQGEQIAGSVCYYAFDHLGSLREISDNSGTVQARYEYDPYGVPSKLAGSFDSDFKYAGYYEHSNSGLNLTMFRAYDPSSARWLSRDPKGEGVNATLYNYANNNPISLIDPLGLRPWDASYSSPDAAGTQALTDINGISIALNTEFGGYVYKDSNGKYGYSDPREGTAGSVTPYDPLQDYAPGPVVADYHTHGDYAHWPFDPHTTGGRALNYIWGPVSCSKANDQFNSDKFSPKDKRGLDSYAEDFPGYAGYLGTPSGNFYKYTPNGDPQHGVVTPLPASPAPK